MLYNGNMPTLNQETVNFIVVVAVVHMVPFLGLSISAMLIRQLPRFGFGQNWGPGAKDLRISGF